ncbi:transglycosylase family protein [Streptomyces sp. WMMC1477]|uniref:transglycosylase family protein n=1 Tax=Streptomyces sp. WMMC1477 TaxID=3015155 RepID=UPI002FC2B708
MSHVQAAPVDTWEKVAACESSGRWHVNTGNGYFGGLQFKQSTWEQYGGTRYAVRADGASKAEQIAVAEKVLAGQGPGAWPACGPEAGLTRGNAEDRAARTGARPASQREAIARQAAREQARQMPGQRRTDDPEGQEHRRGNQTHEVLPGDTLSSIAQDHTVRGGWPALYERNRSTVGDDPDLILPGQRLALRPAPPRPATKSPQPERGAREAAAADSAQDREAGPKGEKKAEKKAEHKTERKAEGRQDRQPAEKRADQRQDQRRAKAPAPQPAPDREQRPADRRQERSAAPAYTAPIPGVRPGTAYRQTGSSWSAGYHTGVDFPVPTGTSVTAVTRATVVSAGWGGAYGYQVVLRHHDGRYSQYAHLSAISVSAGQRVEPGQRVGRAGNTGNSTGPHLHFEIRTGSGYGSDIDPLAYLRAHGVRV